MRISAEALRSVEQHGEESFPRECCGLLVGWRPEDGPRQVVLAFRAQNLDTERAKDRYLLSPDDRRRVEAEAARMGMELVGFYHSHPDHDAYFSETDLQRSEEYQWGEPWVAPSYTYLVTSVKAGRVAAHRAFEVRDGRAVEESLDVADTNAEGR